MTGGKASRKARTLRKGKPQHRHARLYRWELESPAYRSLDVYARALLIELKALYNGANNGELFLSVRGAAERMGITSKSLAGKALRDLEGRGFIFATRKGSITRRAETKLATSWRLTEFDDDLTDRPATRDFMRWRPETPATDDAGKRARFAERARKAARARWSKENSTVPRQASDRSLASIQSAENMLDRTSTRTVERHCARLTVPQRGTQIYLPGERAADADADPASPLSDTTPTTPHDQPAPQRMLTKNGGSAEDGADLSRHPKGRKFGPWLGEQRNALRVQGAELAQAIGIGPSDLYAVEIGQRELGVGLQRKAVAYLRERAG
jgi:hypothetical protein